MNASIPDGSTPKNINQSESMMYQTMKKNLLLHILRQIKLMNNSYANRSHFRLMEVWAVLLSRFVFFGDSYSTC